MRPHAKHILFPLATIALFVTIGAIAVIGLRQAGRFRTLEFNLYDHWVKQRQKESPPRRSPCVLVTITEDDIRAWNHYPITDRMMSDLLEKILQGGPAAVGLDIFRDVPASNETSSLADQERFIKLFQDHPNLVAPIAIYDRPEDSVGVLPRIAQLEGQIAFTNLLQDEDDVVRRSVLQMPDHAGVMQFSLASRLAQMYVGDRFDVSTDEADPWQKFGNVYYRPIHRDGGYVGKVRAQRDLVQMFIDFRAPEFERYSVQDVVTGRVSPQVFHDKVVLIGVWTLSMKDFINTPLHSGNQREFGVTCHARIVDQLIRAAEGESAIARIWSSTRENLLIIGFCVLGGALGWAVRPPWRVLAGASAIVAVSLVAIIVVATLYTTARRAFDRNLWIPVVPPAAGFIACTAMVGLYTGVRGRQERNAMMQLISGFVSDDVAKLIWGDRDEVFTSGGLRPRRQRATMLFTDLKGFSTIAEQMDAQDLMRWLNEYFEGISDLVKDNDGLIMKFNGDQIVAVFGPPRNRTRDDAVEDARNAVRCALKMRHRLRELNEGWSRRGKPQAQMRIGIHTGQLVAGSLGSRKRQEWTVIGHTVNIAARLESLKKDLMPDDIAAHGCRIFISDKTARHLDMSIETRRVGKLALKGIKRRMTVHGVIGWAVPAATTRQHKTTMARANPASEVKRES